MILKIANLDGDMWVSVFKESGFVYCAKSNEIDVRKKESGNNRTLAVASAERVFSDSTWCL